MPVTELDHHADHQDLLWKPAGPLPAGRSPDAIVVPTHRDPGYLTAAATLAHSLTCTLVTLHSDLTSADQAVQRLRPDIDLLAIDVRRAGLWLPDWKTSRLLTQRKFMRRNDLSTKRNLALMLGHMAGWSRILFLDDDIAGIDPDHVRTAIGLLDTHNAAGLDIKGFPDHSVVCHAYRLAGGRQASFVGGGALAVEVPRSNSFFPDIYNDDWFFMLDSKGRLQPVALVGQVRQKRFNPFDPERAQAQEFGDVLAEGLYWLLDQGQPVSAADAEHWASFLAKRRQFIGRVRDMVVKSRLHDSVKQDRAEALEASLVRLAQIKPELCQSYLRAWTADRDLWRQHVRDLPTGLSPDQAPGPLTAPGAPPLHWRWSPAAGLR